MRNTDTNAIPDTLEDKGWLISVLDEFLTMSDEMSDGDFDPDILSAVTRNTSSSGQCRSNLRTNNKLM